MKSKVLTILLSVFVAFALWLYVVTVEHTQVEMTFYNIPVNWSGEDVMEERDLKLTDRNMTISMKLYGNRSVLNKLKSSDIIVLADLTHISEAGEKKLSYDVRFSGVASETIEIVDRPSSIDVQVARWMDRTIPVMVNTEGLVLSPDVGDIHFEIDKDQITHDLLAVDISGPYEVVEKITQAVVFPEMNVDKDTDIRERLNLALCDKDGKRVSDVSSVYVSQGGSTLVTIPVAAVKDVALEMDILENDSLLTKDDILLTLSQTTVTIRGSLDALQNYPSVYKLGQISLKDLTEGFDEKPFAIVLPEGIRCDVESVNVTLRVPEISAQTIQVKASDVLPSGMLEGYPVEITSDVDLVVWCLAEDAAKLKNATIRLKPDYMVEGSAKIAYELVYNGRPISFPIRADGEMAVSVIVKDRALAADLGEQPGIGA